MIEHIFVVGSGLMGSGIAQVAAEAGYHVTLLDRSQADLEKGMDRINKNLMSQVQKGKRLNEDVDEIIHRIRTTTRLQDGKEAQLVIEAIPEKLNLKQDLFRQLDEIMNMDAILATNTSSLSIAAISSVTRRQEQVVGMHFFSPVPIMRLLEIVKSITTSEETVQIAKTVGENLGKEIIVANDFPGFFVNRVLVPMLNEAAYLVYEGNSPEEVDRGMMLGANHPIGPLRLADNVGIGVLLHTMESLYEGFNDSKYRPCPLLKRMVESGLLGKKTGRGFYQY